MTIQEPTEPGRYFVLWHDGGTSVLWQHDPPCIEWFGDWDACGKLWSEIVPHIKAIEPCTPPSWERPRSAMATFDEAVTAQAALYAAHQPPPQPIQLPVEPREPR